MSGVDGGELVGVSAAAAALGINKSSLSRYLAKHQDLVARRTPAGWPLVTIDRVRAHRRANLHEARALASAGAHAGAAPEDLDDRDDELDEGSAGAGHPDSSDRGGERRSSGATLNRARAVEAAAKAQKTQIELARMKRQVCPVSEVQDGAFEAGQVLREALIGQAREIAQRFAVLTGALDREREMEIALVESYRTMLAGLAKRLEKMGEEHDEQAVA